VQSDDGLGVTGEVVAKAAAGSGHKQVKYIKDKNEWDKDAQWAACTDSLLVDEHIRTMSMLARYVDSAISKTLNIPNDYEYNGFKNVYIEAWRQGIKGFTTYRAGTMAHVLSAESSKNTINKIAAIERPRILPCEIHHIIYRSSENPDETHWIVCVGMLDDDPYEVFAFRAKDLPIPNKVDKGELVKRKCHGKHEYDLRPQGAEPVRNIGEYFDSAAEQVVTRLISTSLRHGVDIEHIIDQLLKSEGDIFSFSKVIARTLKKYIKTVKVLKCKSCGSRKLQMAEGCFICLDCGHSACW